MGILEDLLASGTGGWAFFGNSITLPDGAVAGQSRIVIGADIPPELAFYGVTAAILFYGVDSTGVEIGYGFIATAPGDLFDYPVIMLGRTKYPIPGDPSSATPADVVFQTKYIITKTGSFPPSRVEHLGDQRFMNAVYIAQQLEILGFSLLNTDVDSTVNLQGLNRIGPALNDMGRSYVTGISDPGNSGAIGNVETSILPIPAFEYLPGRAYQAIVQGGFKCSVAGNSPIWRLRKTNAAGATVCYFRRTPSGNTALEDDQLYLSKVFTVGAASVTAVLTLCVQGSAAFTVTMDGAFGGRSIAIYDVTDSGPWPDALVLV